MLLEFIVRKIMEKGKGRKFISLIINTTFKLKLTRKIFIKSVEKASYKISLNGPDRPSRVKQERYYMARALLNSIDRAFDMGISKNCLKSLSNIFLGKVFIDGIYTRRIFEEKYGFRPPTFITISPTNVCNLKCIGCYAGEIYTPFTLEYNIFSRILNDLKKECGIYFFVISGGEPFAYRNNGKTLFDIIEEHRDAYFMCYTNSTLIDEQTAKRISEIGNLTPAISVEGFEEETDKRRGKGTFKKIISAMENLRKYGVPFGISVTPTRYNAEFLLSEEFLDFYFNKMGALYGWYFQYMPIGRDPDIDLMITPGQRYKMLKRIWEIVKERKIFISDFWNSANASDGCMSAARGGGYFYIMWNGTITPCVFIPFKDKEFGNIYEIYKRGLKITDAINSPFFKKIREWQDNYWIRRNKNECGNLLVPCIIRDNSKEFYKIVNETGAIPIDEGAKLYLKLIEEGKMIKYNEEWRRLVDPLWKKEYLNQSSIKEL